MNEERHILPYVRRIHIDGLFGYISVDWQLRRGVNVLSGINGSGKSSILQAFAQLLKYGYYKNEQKPLAKIEVYLENGEKIVSDATASSVSGKEYYSNVNVISTFDASLKTSESVRKLTDNKVNSDLDWDLYQVEAKFLKYQLAMGKRAIELLMRGNRPEEVSSLMSRKNLFYDVMDAFFKESGKVIERDKDEIRFRDKNGRLLSPYQLSSGEKQLIIILTTVLCQNGEPYILLMDEPEISLHFDWQKKLIGAVMQLNPELQLILTTHSPAVVMEGWLDRVQDVSDLIVVKPAPSAIPDPQ